MKNITPKNIFWMAILAAVLIIVVLLGSAIEIHNPLMWIANISIAIAILTAGYILGKKSEQNNKK